LLFHDLREVHGYAYSIQSRFAANKLERRFPWNMAAIHRNIVPAESQITAVLSKLQRESIEPDRLLAQGLC